MLTRAKPPKTQWRVCGSHGVLRRFCKEETKTPANDARDWRSKSHACLTTGHQRLEHCRTPLNSSLPWAFKIAVFTNSDFAV